MQLSGPAGQRPMRPSNKVLVYFRTATISALTLLLGWRLNDVREEPASTQLSNPPIPTTASGTGAEIAKASLVVYARPLFRIDSLVDKTNTVDVERERITLAGIILDGDHAIAVLSVAGKLGRWRIGSIIGSKRIVAIDARTITVAAGASEKTVNIGEPL